MINLRSHPATTRRAERVAAVGAAAAMVCCASPLLLSSGALAAASGVAIRAWVPTAIGVVFAVGALTHRKCRARSARTGATSGHDPDSSTVPAHVTVQDAPGSAR